MKVKNIFKESLFFKLISFLFFFFMFVIIGLNILIDHGVDYACKNNVEIPNAILLIIGVVSVFIICFIYRIVLKRYIETLTKKQCNILLIVCCIIFFFIQLYYAYNIYFLTGWDVGVMQESAVGLANGEILNQNFGYYWYFSMYPNNIFLTAIFTMIYKLSMFLGINNYNFFLVVFSVLSINISLWFTVKSTAVIFKNKNYCMFILFIYCIYIMFSPWMVIPYSDTYSIMFTISTLYFYLIRDTINKYIAWFLIFVLAFVGYLIKPTCIIVLIAIVLIEIWNLFFVKNRKLIFEKLRLIPILIISIIFFLGIKSFSMGFLGYEINAETEFPLTHFLMMGMNPETKGVYYEDDVQYTKSINGKNNKEKANLEKVKERLNEYGLVNYTKLLGKKMLTNYNDGTFAWSIEGNFYKQILTEKNDTISPLLRSICYYDGENYQLFACYQQCIWITLLFLMCFIPKKVIKIENDIFVIMLTIIGITLFLLLFEARARYLFLYAPYYIIMAVAGLKELINIITNKYKQKVLKL